MKQASARTCGFVMALFAGAVFAAEPAPSPTEAAPTPKPAASAPQASKPKAKGAADRSAMPQVNTSATAAKSSSAPTKKTNDQLELGATVVTGNRELPKVLYIVPWKKADIGELPGQPFNTLLDEVLTPVDREVFRREVAYYGAVASGATAEGEATPAAAPKQ